MKDINKQLIKELDLREDQGCILFQVCHTLPCNGDYPKISVALGEESVAVCKNTAPLKNGMRLTVRDYGDKLSSLGCPIITELTETQDWIAIGRINITEMTNGQESTTEMVLCLFTKLTKEKPVCNISILICETGFSVFSMEPHDDKRVRVRRWEYAPHAKKEDIEALIKKGVSYIWPTDMCECQDHTSFIFGEGIQLYATSHDKIPTVLLQLNSQTLNATDGEG